MFRCNKCNKELKDKQDWFVVKDKLWKKACEDLGLSEKSILCTSCYENYIGREIQTSDLKLMESTRELPINFWIIRKYKDRSRVAFIRNQQDHFLKIIKDPEKKEKYRKKCSGLVKFLLNGGIR